MKYRDFVRACFPALLAGTLLLLALPALAAAGELVIKPSQLRPLSNVQDDTHSYLGVSGGSATAIFWAPVKLPPGTVIKGLRYQHGSNAGSRTVVGIVRVRPEGVPALQGIYSATSDTATPAVFEFITVTGTLVLDAVKKVAAGWSYAVMASSDNSSSRIGTIRVLY